MKDFFQLREMKVPDTEVELRWSLNRFLEAASKKHSPARIVIIIDGIHRLKADATADGTLYWLPTELPPCVRFIVSTVEFERNFRGKKEHTPHGTFVELMRRQCPVLRIEPLGIQTRQHVVSAFVGLHSGGGAAQRLDLTLQQQAKIINAPSSAQPMYLRALLQALRLSAALTNANLDDLLEKFLACTTAHELIDKNLNICCMTSGSEEGEENVMTDLLGKMLSVIYVSRSGLTEAEIWAILNMVARVGNDEENSKLIMILKDFTMVVEDMYSFSHEIYREVAYQKYISSRSTLLRWHNILARFFGQLPPCDRKLVALPYHLEMAGSWAKVKNCLTDIEMFQIWWTPKFRSDFIKFWASLTKINSSSSYGGGSTTSKGKRHGSADSSDAEGNSSGSSRPTFDIVEEYVKSLDEYRNMKKPSDEIVASIILEIGDFLLEFATLGYENDADVPALVHPKVLPEDLRSLGVPYIEIDEGGRAVLHYPKVLHFACNKQKGEDGGNNPIVSDAPTKAIDDVPVCTDYYYSRWMWIQFPYVALGNCEARFTEGVSQSQLDVNADTQNKGKGADLRHSVSAESNRLKGTGKTPLIAGARSVGSNGSEMSKSWTVDTFKLPKIKFNRKAPRSIPRISKDDEEESNSKVAQRIMALQDNIQNYREEFDFLTQMKAILNKRLQDLKDNLIDLKRTAESCTMYDGALEEAVKREAEAFRKMESVKVLNKNLINLQMMCQRHPADVPALITELQEKIEQDAYLLAEIKKRLWEQRFERQAHQMNFRSIKTLVQEAVHMYNKLANYRQSFASELVTQVKEDERALVSGSKSKSKRTRMADSASSSGPDKGIGLLGVDKDADQSTVAQQQERTQSWEETWSIISSRTGITEPEAFFQRMNNSSALEQQIKQIRKASEGRLEMLKKEVVTVEMELEEVRYEASFAGVQSSKEHKKQLAEKQSKLRQIKEKTEAMEQLEQRAVAGLAHVSDILFIPKSEEDAAVNNLVREIEAVLDTLINEREKQLQQQQGGAGTGVGGRDSTSSVVSCSWFFANVHN